ncbi:uncharacterized protein DEA37_0001964 [Paragonimus westermani]|uniref:Essential MCU regulator, mitochondrial n=1 Tax=Paragonimus westermani TaxID=34504 RepID=A0A5J4NWV7_9TREM|nr:uncharacterized protein DEA37_0001964 [Paragonimus westermani]
MHLLTVFIVAYLAMLDRSACRFWNMYRTPLRHRIKQRSIQCYSGEEGSTMSTGALHGRPHITPFGAVKVLAIVSATIFCGAMISKKGAEFLEENDIFVPDDD